MNHTVPDIAPRCTHTTTRTCAITCHSLAQMVHGPQHPALVSLDFPPAALVVLLSRVAGLAGLVVALHEIHVRAGQEPPAGRVEVGEERMGQRHQRMYTVAATRLPCCCSDALHVAARQCKPLLPSLTCRLAAAGASAHRRRRSPASWASAVHHAVHHVRYIMWRRHYSR